MRRALALFIGIAALASSLLAVQKAHAEAADYVLIEKQQRKLTLFKNKEPIKSYRIALGANPTGKKEREGDGKTPEGKYTIDYHKPDSHFHRALHIAYPNRQDLENAEKKGIKQPGSLIMIHGLGKNFGWLGKLHRKWDWTSGCIAVTNEEIEEIYAAVPDGTPVEIAP